MELVIDYIKDIEVLKNLGVDVIPTNRNYWFVRTQNGTYYDDFLNENFIGIEWDKICDLDFLKRSNEDDIRVEVVKHYPKSKRPGYPAGQIDRFVNQMKKGDIVLVPSKSSLWISFGEILENDIYIDDEDTEYDLSDIIDDIFEQVETNDEKPVLKKRRKIKWFKQVKRYELDPYLYDIIHSHSAIVDVNKYSNYIDRTLSNFYIKGDEAFYTIRVNKKNNIPYKDTLSLLNNNLRVVDFINKYTPDFHIDSDELVLKINIQSKGPIQVKGKIFTILMVGLAISFLCGSDMDFEVWGLKYKNKTDGISTLIKTLHETMKDDNIEEKSKEQQSLIEALNKDIKKLQLEIPKIKSDEIEADVSK